MNQVKDFKKKSLRLFYKHGGNGKIKVFNELDISCREILLTCEEMRSNEMPIIGGIRADCKTLLTNERLIQVFNDKSLKVELSDLVEIKVDLKDLKLNDSTNIKELVLLTKNNGERTLYLENDQSLYGLWNVLLFVSASNKTEN